MLRRRKRSTVIFTITSSSIVLLLLLLFSFFFLLGDHPHGSIRPTRWAQWAVLMALIGRNTTTCVVAIGHNTTTLVALINLITTTCVDLIWQLQPAEKRGGHHHTKLCSMPWLWASQPLKPTFFIEF